MHLAPLIQDLAVILCIAGLVTFLFQQIRQPVVLGYLIAGIIVGPYTPPFSLVEDIPGIQTWAELGVIFLMFSLGLEFSFRKLLNIGKVSVIAATTEVLGMFALGFLFANIFGFNKIESIFLGAMLSISSTTIIVKAFDDLKLKSKKFAGITIGILIIEDIFAILMLIVLSALNSKQLLAGELVKLLAVTGVLFFLGRMVIPKFFNYLAAKSNDEGLTVLSFGLCLSVVVLTSSLGYSAAMGAFIAGSLISESDESVKIEALIKPFSNVFAAVFFVSIGMLLNFADLLVYWKEIIVFTLVTIIGKIVTTGLGVRASGQSSDVAITVGFSLAQIGEFSFIIASYGLSLQLISSSLYSLAVAVSVFTTFSTPYLIRLGSKRVT
jgi:monovalent cation:H+ antiporter-2, CPA2 family